MSANLCAHSNRSPIASPLTIRPSHDTPDRGMQEGKMTLLIVSAIFVIWLFLVLR
jgi:hypothetical protein